MLNKILYSLIAFIGMMLTVAFFTISGESKAGIFDDIKDAVTGHYDDYKSRSLEDMIIDGNKKKFSVADWSSDSVHYVDGSVSIVEAKDGTKYVQLNKDFNAGFAPDLYVYLAKGHITSDDQFKGERMKIELGKLIKGEGASYYKIPSYLNGYVDEEFSVVIHCKRFNEPMGAYHIN